MSTFPDRSITITGGGAGYTYRLKDGPYQASPTFLRDVNGNPWQSNTTYWFYAYHPELAPDPRLVRVFFSEDGIQSVIREEGQLSVGTDDLDDVALRTDLDDEAVAPDGVMMSVLTSVGYILRRYTPASFRTWLALKLDDVVKAGRETREAIIVGKTLLRGLGVVTQAPYHGVRYYDAANQVWDEAYVSTDDLRKSLGMFVMLPGGSKNGDEAHIRHNEDGTYNLIFSDATNIQVAASRGDTTTGPLGAAYYKWSQALPPVPYLNNVMSEFYNPDLGAYIGVKLGIDVLALQILGLIPADAIFQRIAHLIQPAATGPIRAYRVQEIRCYEETVIDPTSGIPVGQTINLVNLVDGATIPHELNTTEFNQIIYRANGRIDLSAYVEASGPNAVVFNNPGGDSLYSGQLILTPKTTAN